MELRVSACSMGQASTYVQYMLRAYVVGQGVFEGAKHLLRVVEVPCTNDLTTRDFAWILKSVKVPPNSPLPTYPVLSIIPFDYSAGSA